MDKKHPNQNETKKKAGDTARRIGTTRETKQNKPNQTKATTHNNLKRKAARDTSDHAAEPYLSSRN